MIARTISSVSSVAGCFRTVSPGDVIVILNQDIPDMETWWLLLIADAKKRAESQILRDAAARRCVDFSEKFEALRAAYAKIQVTP